MSPRFYMSSGEADSEAHAYTASRLLGEPSPQHPEELYLSICLQDSAWYMFSTL